MRPLRVALPVQPFLELAKTREGGKKRRARAENRRAADIGFMYFRHLRSAPARAVFDNA